MLNKQSAIPPTTQGSGFPCGGFGEYSTRECDGTGFYETYKWVCSCKK